MSLRSLSHLSGVLLLSVAVVSCESEPQPDVSVAEPSTVEPRPGIYAEVTLTADLSHLTDNQREMIRILIDASQIMDDLFWKQSFGDDHEAWLDSIGNVDARRFAEINYGPWDRLDDNKSFIEGIGPKPLGARFYPPDM